MIDWSRSTKAEREQVRIALDHYRDRMLKPQRGSRFEVTLPVETWRVFLIDEITDAIPPQ